MSVYNSFGELIRRARERLGWTQDEVAEKVKASRVTVNRWEQDLQHTAVRYLKPLVDTLDLNEKEAYALYYAGGKMPPVRNELPLANRYFTGREGYLEELPKLLQEHRVVALSGLGGIGKTQIALAYAHRSHPDVYPTALWVNAADTETLEADFAALTETLKLPERDEVELKPRIQAVQDWLEAHTDWLLVIDNADDLPIVRPFLPSKPLGYIVLTTRWQFPDKLAKPLAIEVMGMEEGRLFLRRRTNRSPNGDELEAVDRLVDVLGGLALALEQAGAYIQETGASYADYLKLYEENHRSLLDQHGALNDVHSEHPLTVAATFKASFAKVREITPLAEDILHFCAFLQPDAIPEELFQYNDSFKLAPMIFKKGIAALRRYSLIKCNDQEKTFSLHRLVQAVLIDAMSAELQNQWRERVVDALILAFPKSEDPREWLQEKGRCQRILPHAWAIYSTWTPDAMITTLGTLELAELTGFTLFARGQHSLAEPLLAGVVENYEQAWKTELFEIVHVFTALGRIYSHQHKYEQAESLLLRALMMQEEHLGADHPSTADALFQLAALYIQQYKGAQAEPLLVRALAIQEEHLGVAHNLTIVTLFAFALMYQSQGKFDQAEVWYQKAFSRWESHPGLETMHPNALTPFTTWAELLSSSGQYAQADTLFKRVLSEVQRVWPADPYIITLKSPYVRFLRRVGRTAEADALEANDEPSE